jgi:hypothetical protein
MAYYHKRWFTLVVSSPTLWGEVLGSIPGRTILQNNLLVRPWDPPVSHRTRSLALVVGPACWTSCKVSLWDPLECHEPAWQVDVGPACQPLGPVDKSTHRTRQSTIGPACQVHWSVVRVGWCPLDHDMAVRKFANLYSHVDMTRMWNAEVSVTLFY